MELIWEGKYDTDGRKVVPPRPALPFETVEIADCPANRCTRIFDQCHSDPGREQPNRLIRGDKRYVLSSLLPEFAGKVDLIYIDPPFDTGTDFFFSSDLRGGAASGKASCAVTQRAYRDTWGKGPDAYLQWLYETVVLLHELLTDHGSIYVHLDWRAGHYAKAIMDEVFGVACFQNELAWCYREAINSSKRWNRKHDNILFYSKDPARFTFNADAVLNPHSEATKAKYRSRDEIGRYRLMGRGIVGSPVRSARDISQEWEESHPELVYRHYLRDGTYPVDYLNIDIINQASSERLNYPTQKPEALLERIIKASSNEGDLVLDCFCGSGTTAAVAEKLGRRWIACDVGRFAIHAARKRLLGIEGVRPFVVQNLGQHERLAWQAAAFGEEAELREEAYRSFVLDAYKAVTVSGYVRLHGLKTGRMVYVGAVDSTVGEADLQQIALEYRQAIAGSREASAGGGIDVLGWDFAGGLEDVVDRHAAFAGVPLRLVRIPRELLEKGARDPRDVRFFEIPAISVEATTNGLTITFTLKDFVIPLADLPEEMRSAMAGWENWVDYWAVDWDNRDGVFRNAWRAYRTRKNRVLITQTEYVYDEPGTYRILVKVVDVFGNETAKALTVSVEK